MTDLSDILRELIAERDFINTAIAALESVSGKSRKTPKGTLSAAARARIAKAQRARWAKVRAKKKV